MPLCRRLVSAARAHPYRSACTLLALFACTQLAINSSLLCSLLFGRQQERSPDWHGFTLQTDALAARFPRNATNGNGSPQLNQRPPFGDFPPAPASGNTTDSNWTSPEDSAESVELQQLPLCPNVPPGLLGLRPVQSDPAKAPDWHQLAADFPGVRHGGSRPAGCRARQRVAVILPYRNRDTHLRLFLAHLLPMLQRQQLHFRVFAIEQDGASRFNRAMLFNIGYKEATRLFRPDCFVFHDVDLLPEHDHNMYRCGAHPRHMSAAVDKFKYVLPYPTIFGGACALTARHFQTVNGFSNLFFGWGGEDDDFANRVVWAGFKISRYPLSIARYTMIKHKTEEKNKPNPLRFNLIRQGKKRWHSDGLNSLQYTINRVQDRNLVYFITVDIPESQILHRFKLL